MSDRPLATSDPAEPPTPRTAGQVNLAELDDKHLGRYRHPNERRAFVAIILGLIAIAVVLWLARPVLGNVLDFLPTPILRFLSQWIHPTRLGLVLVGLLALMATMDIVGQSTRAWQLVAQAVEVTPTTFPQLAPIVDDLRKRFDLPRTRVYVSRDAPMNGYTIGVRQPYAIVFSSIGVGQLTPDEFKFTLGREMGSIKLGHTRIATLMGNVNMSLPQPFSFLLKFRSVLFGSYHHAQELSCDRIGVVATRNVAPALSTLIKQNLGQVRGAKIDIASLTPQTAELQSGASAAVMRMAMLLNAKPFALARLAELVAWVGEPEPVAPATPAAAPAPTPAASAKAAAASAKAAAASAAAAAASAAAAAEAAAAAARLAAAPVDANGPTVTTTDPEAPEPGVVVTDGASQVAAGSSQGAARDGAGAETAAPAASGASPEASPAAEASAPVASPAVVFEPSGAGAPPPSSSPTEGEAVSVTVPQPPRQEGRIQGGSL